MEDCAGEKCPTGESPIPGPKVACVIRLLLLLFCILMYRTTNTAAATTANVPRTMPTMSPVDRLLGTILVQDPRWHREKQAYAELLLLNDR